MFTKEHILSEIKRTAEENGGTPLGKARFKEATGINDADWLSKHWVRWGDALVEAGYEPNALQGPRDEDEILECLAKFADELGHFPVVSEIRLRARNDPEFPSHNTFRRFGRKRELASRLRSWSEDRGLDSVVELCDQVIAETALSSAPTDDQAEAEPELGYVYLLRSGRFHKIGRTNAVGRRERELAIQLPEKANVVHEIKTDDPAGIEAYWHGRFADRRTNGEWFKLSSADVRAFKRRRFM